MPDHGHRRAVPRAPVLLAIAAALLAGGLADRAGSAPAAATGVTAPPVPVVAPADALSSSWFCAGATGTPGSAAAGTVVVANGGAATASGTVTLLGSRGTRRAAPVSVAPGSQVAVPEAVRGGSPWMGAIVDMDAGAVAVYQQTDGPYGRSSALCATAGSAHWYFASGATLVNASEEISLVNPYPTDAVVDLSFTTDQGPEVPQQFQALDVPPEGMLAVDLGSHLRRRQTIATTVAARSGRVIAWKTDIVTPPRRGQAILGTPAGAGPLADPAAPVAGVTVTLGAARTATRWVWPDGLASNTLDERYIIYNPGPSIAQLSLSIVLDHGVAEPFSVSVGPGEVTSVVSGQEARIPSGVAHSAVLRSVNGVPVVAERTVTASAPTLTGVGELPGAQLSASRWLVPDLPSDAAHAVTLVFYNPAPRPVSVSVGTAGGASSAADLAGLSRLVVGPGRRLAVSLSGRLRPVAGGPLLQVLASGPVYVEADSYGRPPTRGVNLSLAAPFSP